MKDNGLVKNTTKIYENENISLSYYLYFCNQDERTFYSLRIVENGKDGQEEIYLEDITDNREDAEKLTELFTNEGVTVCTAIDILSEVLPL